MRYFLSLILMLMLAAPAMAAKGSADDADEGNIGRFEGPVRGAQAETVEKAMTLAQDSRVVLVGNIVASLAGEKNQYVFKDATGEITVVIPPKQFKELIKPETKVRISGKVEKPANAPDSVRVRVSQMEVIK